MNKNTNFSEKAQYVSPSCKSVEVATDGILCQSGGYNSTWHTELYEVDQVEDI